MADIPWAVIGPIMATIVALFGWVLKLSSQVAELIGRSFELCKMPEHLAQARKDIEMMKNQNQLYDAVIRPHLATIIHSPVHERRDSLVEKLIKEKLNIEEARELDWHLTDLIRTEPDPNKKLAAAFLLSRVKWIIQTEG